MRCNVTNMYLKPIESSGDVIIVIMSQFRFCELLYDIELRDKICIIGAIRFGMLDNID